MKKKLITINILTVLFSMTLLLLTCLGCLYKFNFDNEKHEINNYLNMVCEVYDGTNENEVGEFVNISNPDLRLTIIDQSGEVLYDSFSTGEFESHLERPEIVNLGKSYYRYSDSLNQKMLYIAQFDNGNYIRLALKANSINNLIYSMLIVSSVSLVLIILIVIFLIDKLTKKVMKPLHNEMSKLSELAGMGANSYCDNINIISNNIETIQKNISNKVESLNKEKEKLNYIINNIEEGLIIIDNFKNIVMCNDYVLDIFQTTNEICLNQNYIYLIRNIVIQNYIEDAFEKGDSNTYEYRIDGKVYLINISPIDNGWLNNRGVALLFIDVTSLKESEKMKRDFFANASHELKSPLTTIIGYQQMIDNKIINTPEELDNAVKVTLKEAKRMSYIIKDMLDLARLESDFKIVPQEINLKPIIEETICSFENFINEKNIKVETKLEDMLVKGEEQDLSKLVSNLISNSIKYNKNNGSIFIELKNGELIIKDFGIGIAKEDLNHIFERFYRVDKARSKESLGTGLGLAIVKHVCVTYKYKINVKSKLGEGTECVICFNK